MQGGGNDISVIGCLVSDSLCQNVTEGGSRVHPGISSAVSGSSLGSDLAALLARVEAAETWYDRTSLDLDLAISLGVYVCERRGRDTKEWLYPVDQKEFRTDRAPAYTASLAEALALCERVLPEAAIIIGLRQTPATVPWARVGAPQDGADSIAATPALALIAAMLKALIAQGEAGTTEQSALPGDAD